MTAFKRQLLHDQIAEALRRDLGQLKAGQRLQSDQILARRYSVSLSVMRKALQVISKEGLILRKKRVGTFLSEEFARRQATERPIAITLDNDPSSANTSYFYIRLVQQLRRVMATKGFRTKLYIGELAEAAAPAPQTTDDFTEDMLADKFSGILGVSNHTFGRWSDVAVEKKLPVVGTTYEHPCAVEVVTKAMYTEAAKLLILQGRRDVGLLQWALPWQNPKDPLLHQPFMDTAAKYGVKVRDKWIVSHSFPDQQGGWHAFKKLWEAYPEKPNAVFVADDLLFPGAAAAMNELGIKVPDDLLVLTHANRGSGMLYPFPVVAITYDPEECAEMMTEMMIKLLRKEEVFPRHVQLPFRIVNVDKAPASA
jgi:DNA-binding LacI/PurR family transcriptional regulator